MMDKAVFELGCGGLWCWAGLGFGLVGCGQVSSSLFFLLQFLFFSFCFIFCFISTI
jgi:hypothetical protein